MSFSDVSAGFDPVSVPNDGADHSLDSDARVQEARTLLVSIEAAVQVLLNNHADSEDLKQQASQMLAEIAKVKMSKIKTTTIALCGVSGGGKSSLINALVQDDIVPTSSMEACTSSVTRVSWHDSDHIVATIKFSSYSDWEVDISTVLQELKDGAKDDTKLGEQAGQSWYRFKVVYPDLSRDLARLASMGVRAVLDHVPRIRTFLGGEHTIDALDAGTFNDKLTHFLGPIQGAVTDSRLWPIVTLIDVRCNAPLLSTQLVFLDLPGLGDRNLARGGIAIKHLGQADHICVVTASPRAVSEQLAGDLLGDALLTQLQMDNSFNAQNVSVIATKMDDFDPTDVINQCQLRSDVAFGPIFDKREQVNNAYQVEDNNMNRLRRDKKVLSDQLNEMKNLSSSSGPSRSVPGREPPQRSVSSYEEKLKIVKDSIIDSAERRDALREETRRAEAAFNIYCARARAQYIESQMKKQFHETRRSLSSRQRGGVRTISFSDCENSVSVFSCSSREHRKMKNHQESAFERVEDTGIPAIYDWCLLLAKPRKAQAVAQLLDNVERLAQSLADLVSHNQGLNQVRARLRDTLITNGMLRDGSLQRYLIDNIFTDVVDKVMEHLNECFKTELWDDIEIGSIMSAARALPCYEDFADKKHTHWSTYRATLIHHGDFHVDLNSMLARPMKQHISGSWEHVFSQDLVTHKKHDLRLPLSRFFQEVQDFLPPELERTAPRRNNLNAWKRNAQRDIDIAFETSQLSLQKKQRALSRGITSTVQENLIPGYGLAKGQHGPGCIARIKSNFRMYLEDNRDDIFKHKTRMTLQTALTAAAEDVCDELEQALEGVAEMMARKMAVLWQQVQKSSPTALTLSGAHIEACRVIAAQVGESVRALRDGQGSEELRRYDSDWATPAPVEDDSTETSD